MGRSDASIEFAGYDDYDEPAITDEMIAVSGQRLGVWLPDAYIRLPEAYIRLLRVRNRGEPVRHCHPVSFPDLVRRGLHRLWGDPRHRRRAPCPGAASG